MSTILYISASIALLALAGLFIYLIMLLRGSKDLVDNVTKTVGGITNEISQIRLSLAGTIQNVEAITGKVDGTVDRLNTSMDRVNAQLGEVEGIVGSVRQMTADVTRIADDATDVVHAAKNVVISIVDLEQDIQRKVQAPVVEALGLLNAVGRGIRVFREKLAGTAPGASDGLVTNPRTGTTPSGDGLPARRANGVTTTVYQKV